MSDPSGYYAIVVTVFIWLIAITAAGAFWAGQVSNKLASYKERLDSGADRMDDIEDAHVKLDKSVTSLGGKMDVCNAHLARIDRQNRQIWSEITQRVGARAPA